MSAPKRRPVSDLNHDNWDDEQPEDEEQGEFRKASDEVLKQRTFKTAKRRVRGADGGDESAAPSAASAFSGFGGFGAKSTTTGAAASSPFSFLSSAAATAPAPALANPAPSMSFASAVKSSNLATTAVPPAFAATAGKKEGVDGDAIYLGKLSELNKSVSAWIAKHIAENPVCLLTPIFEDYAKHLKDIQQSKSTSAAVPSFAPSASPSKAAAATAPKPSPDKKSTTSDFTFKSAAPASNPTGLGSSSGFSFGSLTAAAKPTATMELSSESESSSSAEPVAALAPKSTFSFGGLNSKASDDKPSTSFSFGSAAAAAGSSASGGGASSGFSFGGIGAGGASKPFTFANIKTPADREKEAAAAGGASGSGAGGADDDNEEPPKNEFTPVVEDDSLFQQRCKVFVKSGGEFVDRGVGQLFIKSAAGGTKTQLLVRADTNLGNILLNILLSDAVPASRMGKNNVMVMCVPTPETKPATPVSVLVRVKGAEEADELLAQINKHKK